MANPRQNVGLPGLAAKILYRRHQVADDIQQPDGPEKQQWKLAESARPYAVKKPQFDGMHRSGSDLEGM